MMNTPSWPTLMTKRGTYFLKRTPVGRAPDIFHVGYITAEDTKPNGDIWVTRCPYVLMEESVADRRYGSIKLAKEGIDFLQTKCTEYPLPKTITVKY